MKERRREYLVTLVFNYGFASNGKDKITSYIEELLKKYQGELLKIQFLGERKFAYFIKHQQLGYYVFVLCKLPTQLVRFFRRDMELSDNIILRSLILKKEEAEKVLSLSELVEYNKEEKNNGTLTK